MPKVYFEDFTPGRVFELGSHTLTREAIIEFASQFDPQPFHLDEEAGKRSHFGGLVASGWHTVGIMMRLLVEGLIGQSSSMGSPGVDEVRWLKPVRPGDTLHLRYTIHEAVPSRSKPDRGVVRGVMEMINQHGDVVMTVKGMGMYGRRPA